MELDFQARPPRRTAGLYGVVQFGDAGVNGQEVTLSRRRGARDGVRLEDGRELEGMEKIVQST